MKAQAYAFIPIGIPEGFDKIPIVDGASTDRQCFYETLKSAQVSPEKILLLAVLDDAINCLLKAKQKTPNEKKDYRECKAWLESSESDYVFSFVRVCEAFQWEPSAVRKKVKAMLSKKE